MTYTDTVQLLSSLDGVLSCLIDGEHRSSLKSANIQCITYRDITDLFKAIQTNFPSNVLSCTTNNTCAVLITKEHMINSPGLLEYRKIEIWPELNSSVYTRDSDQWVLDKSLQITSQQDVRGLISDAMLNNLDAKKWFGLAIARK